MKIGSEHNALGLQEGIHWHINPNIKIEYIPKIKEQKYITFSIKVDFNDIFDFKPDYSFEDGIKEFGEILKNEN